MADAPDPGDAKDSAKDDAPAVATPPDQGSAVELELSQALIELSSGARPRGGDPPLLHRDTATGAHGTARGRPAMHAGPSRKRTPLPLRGPQSPKGHSLGYQPPSDA